MDTPENELFNQSYDSISDDDISMEEINKADDVSGTTSEGEAESTTKETTTETETTDPDTDIDLGDMLPSEGTEEGGTSDTDTINTDTSPGSGEDSSPVTPFASLLHEKGLLPNLDLEDFNKTEDKIGALMKAVGQEIGYANQQFIHSFPPELIEAAKAVSEGIPYEDIEKSVLKEIEYNKVTEEQLEEDETLQKRLVSDFLTSKGFPEDKITGLVDTYEDSGKLKKEATDSLAELKVLAKQYQKQVKEHHQKQQVNFEKQHKEKLQYIGEAINNTTEIIPGKKLGDTDKETLYNQMTQIVGKDEQGNPIPFTMALRQKDPLKFDMAVTYLADMTKGFTDFSTINQSAKSTALKDLESTLESNTTHSSGIPKTAPGSGTESELMTSLQTMFGNK